MKKIFLLALVLALSSFLVAQAPVLIPTTDGWALPPGVTPVSGLLGDRFAANCKVLTPGCASGGGAPSSPVFSIQFNNAGAFGGTGALLTDANGALIVNPAPSSVAGEAMLTVFGDSFTADDVADFFAGTSGQPNVEVTNQGTLNIAPGSVPSVTEAAVNIIGDTHGNDILDLFTNGGGGATSWFDNAGVLHVPGCDGCGGGGSVFPQPSITTPVAGSFTFGHQNSATVASKTQRLVFTVPDSNPNVVYTSFFMAKPSPPFTVDFAFSVAAANVANANDIGVGFSIAATGQAHDISFSNIGGNLSPPAMQSIVLVNFWTTYILFASSPVAFQATESQQIHYLRLTDDGTNRDYYYSTNGLDFLEVYTEADTVFTPDSIAMDFYNNAAGTHPNEVVSVYNWTVSNSILPIISD